MKYAHAWIIDGNQLTIKNEELGIKIIPCRMQMGNS